MKTLSVLLIGSTLLAGRVTSHALERFVSQAGGNVSPFTNWSDAATNIQDAIDVASDGDVIWVTNGIYATGGKVMAGDLTNRVALDKAITVQSVNGPSVTTIQGNGAAPGTSAVRCAWLTNSAALRGFTLTGGATSAGDSGGGAWCNSTSSLLADCVVASNSAAYRGGGVYSGSLTNCTLTGNLAGSGGGGGSAYSLLESCTSTYNSSSSGWGGGSYYGTLNNCIIMSNSATSGGGAAYGSLSNCNLTGNSVTTPGNGGGSYYGTLVSCTLAANTASSAGGGSASSMLTNSVLLSNVSGNSGGGASGGVQQNCLVISNTAIYGGGARSSTLINCKLVGNSAQGGGGSDLGKLKNCYVTGNSATTSGGGASGSTLTNCTVTGNAAGFAGGGTFSGTLMNCIVWSNSASTNANAHMGFAYYTCSFPLAVGPGNISSDPQISEAFHLAVTSPCRGMGSLLATTGADLDGEPWLNPPSMGCDEATEASLVGPLSVFIEAAQDTLLVNRMLSFTGHVTGLCARLQWNFGDGPAVTNASYLTSHTWTNAGDYRVTLTAFNADNPAGVATNLLVHVLPIEAPTATVVSMSGIRFQLQFPGQAAADYWVEYTTNLTPPIAWVTVSTLTSTGGVVQVTDTKATNDARFYRVRAQ